MVSKREECSECRYEHVPAFKEVCEHCKSGFSAFVPKHKSVSDGRVKFYDTPTDYVEKE